MIPSENIHQKASCLHQWVLKVLDHCNLICLGAFPITLGTIKCMWQTGVIIAYRF